MRVIVLGAGILGVSTAWYLQAQGHEVTVVERQPDAALETSYANGGQISVSFCEPWANRHAPWKVFKWLLRRDAPLLLRPQLDPNQWRWCLAFLAHCHDAAFEHHVRALIGLGRYSQQALHELVRDTGIAYDRETRGILHFVGSQQELDAAAQAATMMKRFGLDRQVLDRDQVLAVEPALRHHGPHIAGGTYTRSDESGDACTFTQQLAQRAAARGVRFLFDHTAQGLDMVGGQVESVRVGAGRAEAAMSADRTRTLPADAVVVAMGAHSAPFLRQHGLRVNIYPAKGYSATLALLRPQDASRVSLMDDERKLAITRLGDRMRVAGTAELGGYDLSLDTTVARLRCQALVERFEALFPGVADTRAPTLWAGLRPSTPSNVPLIGRAPRLGNVWLNTGHGTLGWTHGAGSGRALAELIAGRRPALDFPFLGVPEAATEGAHATVS